MPTFYSVITEKWDPYNTQIETFTTIWMGMNEKKARRVYDQYITGVKRTPDCFDLSRLRLVKTVVDDIATEVLLENECFMDTKWWYPEYQKINEKK